MSLAGRYRDIISGRSRGPLAMMARGLLRMAETPYCTAVTYRNRRYDLRRAEIVRVDRPVVSVGNLTLGGTGKTPTVEWLARWFIDRGLRVGLVSRGYKSEESGKLNDEALELAHRLPDVPHIQHADRYAAATQLVEEHAPDVILLDDGFQHRRLHRDLDIVLIDATEPYGFGHVFPRGTLREPLASLRRADAVILTRADMLSSDERVAICNRLAPYLENAVWAEAACQPRRLLSASGNEAPVAELSGKRVAAFCGIGNPASFRHTLAACGCTLVAWREFPDHHHYNDADLDQLSRWAAEADSLDMVVCTHKDFVKIDIDSLGEVPLRAVTIELILTAGEEAVEDRLRRVAMGSPRESP